MKKLKHIDGARAHRCPIEGCKEMITNIGEAVIDCGIFYKPWKCEKCGTTGIAMYEFSEHTYTPK